MFPSETDSEQPHQVALEVLHHLPSYWVSYCSSRDAMYIAAAKSYFLTPSDWQCLEPAQYSKCMCKEAALGATCSKTCTVSKSFVGCHKAEHAIRDLLDTCQATDAEILAAQKGQLRDELFVIAIILFPGLADIIIKQFHLQEALMRKAVNERKRVSFWEATQK
eukprot:1157074-Pelagomonas_calceolata.AAC.2